MASPAQIEANRRNAQKSTGPRSVDGKASSRFNALKSGIDAKSLVIPGEDPAELAALAANYQLEFQPASPVEQFLVDCLVRIDWQLRRLHKAEAHLWQEAGDCPSPTLIRVCRLIDTRERAYFQDVKELQRRQAARQQTEEAEEAPAEVASPTEIGFDPSKFINPPPIVNLEAQLTTSVSSPAPDSRPPNPIKSFDPRALRL